MLIKLVLVCEMTYSVLSLINRENKIMGYEVKIMIGEVGSPTDKLLREQKPKVEANGEVWHPYAKDADDNYVKTGKLETYFMIAVEIDMCKIGGSHLFKALNKNTSDINEYYWYGYDGNTRISEDRYGDKPEVTSILECITALKKDIKESEHYRRFDWALALLESMKDSDMQVLWFGH